MELHGNTGSVTEQRVRFWSSGCFVTPCLGLPGSRRGSFGASDPGSIEAGTQEAQAEVLGGGCSRASTRSLRAGRIRSGPGSLCRFRDPRRKTTPPALSLHQPKVRSGQSSATTAGRASHRSSEAHAPHLCMAGNAPRGSHTVGRPRVCSWVFLPDTRQTQKYEKIMPSTRVPRSSPPSSSLSDLWPRSP